jgi:protein-disulfide isomerase
VVDLALLVIVQWFILKSFCLLCILTYLATFIHLLVNFYRSKCEKPSTPIQNLFWGNQPWTFKYFSKPQLLLAFFSLVIFGLFTAFLPSWIQTRAPGWEDRKAAINIFMDEWSKTPNIEIETNEWDGHFGNPEAKLKIVIFSDFECPFCKKAAFTLHTLLPSFQKDVSVTFKHFPLDSSCNSMVPRPMHLYACSLARLAICANEKGKFWDYHDTVFMKLDETDLKAGWDELRTKLSSIFSSEEIDSCLKASSPLEKVKKDIEIGLGLGILGTPALFANGKPLTVPLDFEGLRQLVELSKKQ